MAPFAYLFERFPSFGQTFCYREVAELYRQGVAVPIFSIRNPKDEPVQDWDARIVQRVHYLPEEMELLDDGRRAAKKGKPAPEIVAALDGWGRRTDFLRLYQAVYVGLRLQEAGSSHVHAHFRATVMLPSLAWQRPQLSGSANFFQSLLALPRMPTTFLRQGSLRLVWTNLL